MADRWFSLVTAHRGTHHDHYMIKNRDKMRGEMQSKTHPVYIQMQ